MAFTRNGERVFFQDGQLFSNETFTDSDLDVMIQRVQKQTGEIMPVYSYRPHDSHSEQTLRDLWNALNSKPQNAFIGVLYSKESPLQFCCQRFLTTTDDDLLLLEEEERSAVTALKSQFGQQGSVAFYINCPSGNDAGDPRSVWFLEKNVPSNFQTTLGIISQLVTASSIDEIPNIDQAFKDHARESKDQNNGNTTSQNAASNANAPEESPQESSWTLLNILCSSIMIKTNALFFVGGLFAIATGGNSLVVNIGIGCAIGGGSGLLFGHLFAKEDQQPAEQLGVRTSARARVLT